jgi:hypothetical protein
MILASANTGFYVGLSLGFIVVAVVVAIVAMILTQASRIADQASTAAAVLEQVRANTDVLPAVATTNEHAVAILQGASAAREALTG